MVIKSCTKERINIGDHKSSIWTKNFNGTFCREITGDVENFKVDLDAKSGGFDTSIFRQNKAIRVDDVVNSRTKISSKIDVSRLDGSAGNWWVGPKFPVKEKVSQGLPGNYENYVVENATRSPQEYHKRLTVRGGKYLGQTKQDGSRYKHYLRPSKNFEQFWAVRQNYRSDGSVSMAPILNMWRKNGLPNQYMNIVKTNVETQGKVKGTIEISNIDIPKW